jgi:nucleotide-binding universal stress UspA family protein
MKKILVPVDFNPLSSAALEYAAQLAVRADAELIVLYADRFDPPAEFTALQTKTLVASIAESRRRTAEELERYAHEHVPETIAMRTELREALPLPGILAAIEQHQPDLVVMGTHGRGALARLMLGSVTESVLGATTVPILTINHPDAARTAGDSVHVASESDDPERARELARSLALRPILVSGHEARHSITPVLHLASRRVR